MGKESGNDQFGGRSYYHKLSTVANYFITLAVKVRKLSILIYLKTVPSSGSIPWGWHYSDLEESNWEVSTHSWNKFLYVKCRQKSDRGEIFRQGSREPIHLNYELITKRTKGNYEKSDPYHCTEHARCSWVPLSPLSVDRLRRKGLRWDWHTEQLDKTWSLTISDRGEFFVKGFRPILLNYELIIGTERVFRNQN